MYIYIDHKVLRDSQGSTRDDQSSIRAGSLAVEKDLALHPYSAEARGGQGVGKCLLFVHALSIRALTLNCRFTWL